MRTYLPVVLLLNVGEESRVAEVGFAAGTAEIPFGFTLGAGLLLLVDPFVLTHSDKERLIKIIERVSWDLWLDLPPH